MKNRPLTVKQVRRNLIIKWTLYVLMALVALLIMTVQKKTTATALLLIPVALCITMKERHEIVSSLVGMVCGFMLDAACGKLFGFNAFLLMVMCMFSSLLFLYLMRQNIVNILIINTTAVIVQGLLDYFFFYGMWGNADNDFIFVHFYLPSMIFTVIAGPVVYILVHLINRKFGPREEYFLEEKSEDIVRV